MTQTGWRATSLFHFCMEADLKDEELARSGAEDLAAAIHVDGHHAGHGA